MSPGTLQLEGATSGVTSLIPTDAVSPVFTLPAVSGTLVTLATLQGQLQGNNLYMAVNFGGF